MSFNAWNGIESFTKLPAAFNFKEETLLIRNVNVKRHLLNIGSKWKPEFHHGNWRRFNMVYTSTTFRYVVSIIELPGTKSIRILV